MRKLNFSGKIFFLIYLILINTPVLSLDIDVYDYEKIAVLPIGKNNNEISYIPKPGPGASKGPTHYAFAPDGTFYICDYYNGKIKLFNTEFNYIKNMVIDDCLAEKYIRDIQFDSNNNIYIVAAEKGLYKIDKNHEALMLFPYNKNFYSLYSSRNYFIIEDFFIYFMRYGEDTLMIKNINGKEITESQYTAFINKNRLEILNTFQFKNNESKEKFLHIIEENNMLFKKGGLLSVRFRLHRSYFNGLKETVDTKTINLTDKKDYSFSTEKNSHINIGSDNNLNTYWLCFKGWANRYLLVLSKYGEVLDYFETELLYNSSTVIHPNGDIYFLNIDENGLHIYRIRNTWDPINTKTTDTPAPPKALSITATSFIDWKNTYIPAKAFDGNLKTCWLEAADGPGTGESITLKLDKEIVVDEIKAAPGFFNPKWWKLNNRVNVLTIKYNNKSQDLQFKDEMTLQSVKLADEIRFSVITFEIKKVYLSDKDNDTGISEIEFYSKGKKVEIDISEVK